MPENGGMPDSPDLEPLFKTILETIPAPTYVEGAPLQAHVTNLDASPFLGRLALVRIHQGYLKKGQQVAWIKRDGTVKNVKITELLVTEGLERKPGEQAGPGDIVAVAGIPEITIGETLADPENPVALPLIHVDEPAISMTIGTNTSPLVGPGSRAPRSPRGWSRTGSTPSWSATCRCRSSRPTAPTPGRCRAAASWRWRSWSSRCGARASS